jgi:hypothetical protein
MLGLKAQGSGLTQRFEAQVELTLNFFIAFV